ncbi:AGC/NDR protein kinase, variant [Allomyces macrogynus ATCC 38327]|nr:AGC/NDR protein kinase, variant [Allomyces macrogynus ATCC 38327]|eukprot:KNE58959.1 AGC/NDR protein kinase, variant [Allomyces macrogynus ATCC 38327]
MSTTTTGRNKRRLQLEADLEALNVSEDEKRTIRRQWLQKETEYIRSLRSRVTLNDFDLLKPLGRGAFGMIRLARDKNTGNLVALKTLDKATMLRRGQEGHVRAERDLLCQASDSCNFIVKLFYSFQDEHNLYLGLEYMPGGDLLSLLIKCDIFPEWMARFYAAEMLLAIEEAHSLGYRTHDAEYYDAQRRMLETARGRDGGTGTPPRGTAGAAGDALNDDDNITITPELLVLFKSQRRAQAFSIVGTTNYMAPEVLAGSGHDFKCDLWSFATILFEMLFGYPPFHHSSPSVTRQKILRCHYVFPAHAAAVSPEARDLMAQLLVRDPATRPGLKEAMAHPWFRVPIDGQTVDWEAMRDGVVPPPWVPQLKNELDTSCFEDAAAAGDGVGVPPGPPTVGEARMPGESDEALDLRKRMAFKGFTFKTFQP